MSYVSAAALGLLAALLQATFTPQIRFNAGEPDLVFLFTLAWSLRADMAETLTLAGVGGVAADLLSAAPTGTSVLGLLPLIYAVNALRTQLYNMRLPLIALLTLAASFVYEFVGFVALSLAGYSLRPFDLLVNAILPTVVYNLVFLIPALIFVRVVQWRIGLRGRESA